MRTRLVLLVLPVAWVASCSEYGEDAPSDQPDAATPFDGGIGVDATNEDATALADAPVVVDGAPPYIKPPCYLTGDASAPTASIVVSPDPPTANVRLDFAATAIQGYAGVSFQICAANGTLIDPENGLIDATGTPIRWYYSLPDGLPAQWIQAQFYSEVTTGRVLRGKADFYIAPK